MSDVLTNHAPLTADGLQLPAGTPLPPPPPPSLDDDDPGSRQRILAVIGVIALLVAAVMGVLWFSARGDLDDAAAERDAAQAATAAEADRAVGALADLATTRADLDAAATANEGLVADVEAAEAATTEAATTAEAADAATAALETRNSELAAEIAALQSSLADAETAAADATAAAAEVPDAPEPEAFDIAAAVDFARYIGERLASIEGPSVLGQGQHTCLGTAVVNDIGLDAIGAGLRSDASSGASSAVAEATERGAISCGIDPSAIF